MGLWFGNREILALSVRKYRPRFPSGSQSQWRSGASVACDPLTGWASVSWPPTHTIDFSSCRNWSTVRPNELFGGVGVQCGFMSVVSGPCRETDSGVGSRARVAGGVLAVALSLRGNLQAPFGQVRPSQSLTWKAILHHKFCSAVRSLSIYLSIIFLCRSTALRVD